MKTIESGLRGRRLRRSNVPLLEALPSNGGKIHCFSAFPRKSNNAFVAGSSGKPMSALILLVAVGVFSFCI
jgi:hypothetical protein